jgi:hypothetical protein
VRIVVHEAPPPLNVWLNFTFDFVAPGGPPQTSFLPGFEPEVYRGSLPVTLVARVIVPVETPRDPSIPLGVRVTAMSVWLRAAPATRGPGMIATYPVVD